MIRNTMFLIAMSIGMVGIFTGEPKFFFAGGLIALTTLFIRFKSEPQAPPRPKQVVTPIEILQTELENLNTEMSEMSIMDGNDKDCYLAVVAQRTKIHEGLLDLAKAQK